MKNAKRIKSALLWPFEWLGIALGALVFGGLPHKALNALADVLSAVVYFFDRRGRRMALKNLRIITSSTRRGAPTRREKLIIRRSYRNMARTVAHIFWTMTDARRKVAEVGLASVACAEMLKVKEPQVLVSGHIGCWEVLSQIALMNGCKIMSVAKKIGTSGISRALMRARESIGQEIVPADGAFRVLMKGIKDGKSLGLLVDQAVSPADGGVWVRFFGRPVPVSAAPAFFSAKGRCRMCTAWCRPLADGTYRCEVIGMHSVEESRNLWKLTQSCIKDLEGVIRRHPSCWLLCYNEFRKHPTLDEYAKLLQNEGKCARGESPADHVRPLKLMQLVPAMEQGGVERGVVEMNGVITRHGWRNIVVSAGGRLADRITADGGRHITMDVKSKNPLTYFARAAKLRKLLEEERPDVVCAHSRVPAWLYVRAAKGLGIPWITFAHGANSISPYSRVMTFGNITVTPSLYIADYLKKAYGISDRRLRIIPRAIERERFDIDRLDRQFIERAKADWRTEGKKIVMGVGRITQLKGYDILIKAMSHLDDGFKLVIVGEAEELRKDVEEALHALVKELGLESRVVFAGNQQKIAECLSIADVVVSSNIKKPEAFGRSMAEALAMGKPVVAKAFGGALDIVASGENGELVEEGTPEEFAQAIDKVAKTTYNDLRTAALEKFSFDKMARTSLETYLEVYLKNL